LKIDEFREDRLTQLDILRGITCLWIVLFHYTARFNFYDNQPLCWHINLPFAYDVVHLFFIISGFVIFMMLEKTKRPFDFLVSRFSRLFPMFWLTILGASTLILWFKIPDSALVTLRTGLINATMVPSFFNVQYIDGVYWTLEIEFVFYAIMFSIVMFRSLRHTNVIMSILLVISCAIVQMVRMKIMREELIWSYLKIARYLPWFCLGIASYQFYKTKRLTVGCVFLAAMALLSSLFIVDTGWYQRFVNIGVMVLFLIVLFYKPQPFMRPFVFLGAISYPFYLIHQNIGYVFITHIYTITKNVNFSIFLAIIFVISIASFLMLFVERPLTRFIRNAYKSFRKPALKTTPPLTEHKLLTMN